MILTSASLPGILKKLRREGKKLVFTNGCFDIIHYGHVDYLEKAKKMGDALMVGLNSDSSVRRLKGKTRPINGQKARARVLGALKPVDFVVIFTQDTPLELIKKVRPDVLVKGGDWKPKDIVGSGFVQSYGGRVRSIKYVKNFSTSSIIEKAVKLNI